MMLRGLALLLALVCVAVGPVSSLAVRQNTTTSQQKHRDFPAIKSMKPSTGVFTGGTYVQIRGVKMAGATHCRFGLTVMPVLKVDHHITRVPINAPDQAVVHEHTVTCESPANDPGPAKVQVSMDEGNTWWPMDSKADPVTGNDPTVYNFYELPEVVDMRPTEGPASGGTHIRVGILSKGFDKSPDRDAAAFMIGDNLTTVDEMECIKWGPCYLKAAIPQICFWPGPACKKTVPVYVSLNGQDFTQDPKNKLTFDYQNEWIYPSLLQTDLEEAPLDPVQSS